MIIKSISLGASSMALAPSSMALAPELQTFRTEEIFGQHLKQIAELLGYLAYHTHDSRHSADGFPDWILLRARKTPLRLLAVELKLAPASQKRGRPRAEQQLWLDDFAAFGRILGGWTNDSPIAPRVEAYVWRPSDWFDGTIEQVLKVYG